ncbi:zinc finger protein JACKDAW-like isoform X2 [Bidens hawaiensis]|uniref:zinc finger protein JACKDAW-like isoform X2 n=1 Tax=Bidens hawaiensis TaxID=980011 RepID=UPI0040495046
MMSSDGVSSPPPSNTPLIHDPITNPNPNASNSNSAKRKRNLAGNPDAEVIALSPKSLMETNRFVCDVCNKGFQRDQNLQLHRRGHNLPWKLKQRNKLEVVRKKVYICPETSCVHHHPSRALGDLTGVKKHFSRKHGEKKWKCDKCSKKYAVKSDWKAHSKICGTREYKCDCGTLFSRKDSFITHRAFCDALTEDNSRMTSFGFMSTATNIGFQNDLMMMKPRLPIWQQQHDTININPMENMGTSSRFLGSSSSNNNINNGGMLSSDMMQWLCRSQEPTTDQGFAEMPQGLCLKDEEETTKGENEIHLNPLYNNYGGCTNVTNHAPPPHMSATALLQKASQMGSTRSTTSSGFGLMNTSELSGFKSLNRSENFSSGVMDGDGLMMMMSGLTEKSGGAEGNLTRDFLGVEGNERRAFSLQQELIKFSCPMNDGSNIGFNGSQ